MPTARAAHRAEKTAYFPAPQDFGEDDIVAIGGSLTTPMILEAYRKGVFPWPILGLPLTWFCPMKRGILDFKDLHVPRSRKKEQNKKEFKFTINSAFDDVITQCAKVPRPNQGHAESWITPKMISAYSELHALGNAHSVEAWDDKFHLVGGIYGVAVDGVFSAESMFYKTPYASKLALLHLIEHLKNRGLGWLDIQMVTPHMKAMGAKSISRKQFLARLNKTKNPRTSLF